MLANCRNEGQLEAANRGECTPAVFQDGVSGQCPIGGPSAQSPAARRPWRCDPRDARSSAVRASEGSRSRGPLKLVVRFVQDRRWYSDIIFNVGANRGDDNPQELTGNCAGCGRDWMVRKPSSDRQQSAGACPHTKTGEHLRDHDQRETAGGVLVTARKSGEDYTEFPSDAGVFAIFSAEAQEKYIPGSTEAEKNRSVILEFRSATSTRSTGDYRAW
jgi:hypothetical protein